MDDEKLTRNEAAKLMGIARITLYNWAGKKGPPFYILGDTVVYYRKSEVEQWMRDNTVRITPEDDVPEVANG